jgi:ABC-type uncharacterized transport system permease subunit
MELIFGLTALYPLFLVALHVPMLLAFFVLKRHRLLQPWHFVVTCVGVFSLGHAIAAAVVVQGWPGFLMPLVGAVLGAVCGFVWWYILVRWVGVGGHSRGKIRAA